jgi:hypothetical protein
MWKASKSSSGSHRRNAQSRRVSLFRRSVAAALRAAFAELEARRRGQDRALKSDSPAVCRRSGAQYAASAKPTVPLVPPDNTDPSDIMPLDQRCPTSES